MILINPDKLKLVEFILEKEIKGDKTPSIQYTIFNKDQILFNFNKGLADIDKKIPTTEKTTFNSFSVTKTFTALAILQLVELGKLHLDQSVKSILPEFQYNGDITIKHLLTHTAGIPNPIPLNWIHLPEEHKMFNWNNYFQLIFNNHNKTKFKPNDKFSYSNLGYVLLGQIIEKVSAKRYEDFIRENIIIPLNLNPENLDFMVNNMKLHAKGYHKKWSFSNLLLGLLIDRSKFIDKSEGSWISFKTNYINGPSYGGLIGTSGSFVCYLQELLKPECKLIANNFKLLLFTENSTNDNKPTGMCLSWFKGQLCGHNYYAHAGGGGGYYCELRIYPELELGSVIMLNRTGMTDERILNKFDVHFISD